MGVDVTRLDVAGPVTSHHDATVATDGPWLLVTADDDGTLELLVPSHATVAVEPCEGRCARGGE